MMWTRAQIKSAAKAELRVSYWVSFAVTLVAVILGAAAGGSSGSFGSTWKWESSDFSMDYERFASQAQAASENPYMTTAIATGSAVFSLIVFAYIILVAFPLAVGVCNFFIKAPYGERNFSLLFSSFKSGKYGKAIGTMFMVGLFTFLWSLLFFIPGIVKAYSYRMAPYIIADNPDLTWREAIDRSKQMTKGHKWRMFVLDLSWIGWGILAAITCVGYFFLAPYVEATNAQLYFVLRSSWYEKTYGTTAANTQ